MQIIALNIRVYIYIFSKYETRKMPSKYKIKSNKGIRFAVFDCDGTIADSQHSIVKCMHAAFEAYKLPKPKRDDIRRVIGLPLQEAIAYLVSDTGCHDTVGISKKYGHAWDLLREKGELEEPLFSGILETINILQKNNWLLGIATGKSLRGLNGTLKKYDILDHFTTIQTADKGPGKPHPDMLLNGMEETGVTTASTVMIGDTTFDMKMAVNAGVMGIGVSWGYHTVEDLRSAGATHVIYSFEQLTSLLIG